MAYSTSLPGLDEARLDAIKTMLTNGLSGLNTTLARDGLTPMVWTAAQIVIGDTLRLSASRISIVGGGEHDGQDLEAERYFAPINETQGYKETLATNIYVYIHPDEFPSSDPLAQAAMRERALSRICDHLRRRVFNAVGNDTMTLTSQEHASGGSYDALIACRVKAIYKGVTGKDFGGQVEVLTAHLIHEGVIA